MQITNIRNERGNITTDPIDIKTYYKQLYAHKFNNLDEMNKFLEIHKLPKQTQEQKLFTVLYLLKKCSKLKIFPQKELYIQFHWMDSIKFEKNNTNLY